MNREQALEIINEWIDGAAHEQLAIYASIVDYGHESITLELLKRTHSKLNSLKDLREYIKENLK